MKEKKALVYNNNVFKRIKLAIPEEELKIEE